MNRTYLTVVVGVLFVAAAFVGGYLWRGGTSASPSPTAAITMTPTGTRTATPVAQTSPKLYTVALTAQGLSPKSLTIRVGDAVTFRNDGAAAFWPASDPHPAHTLCPWLDAARGLRTGEEYTVVFAQPVTCPYHDHLDPADATHAGTITAQ